MITIEEGNILDDKYTMICHQVNTLGIMGAGLAKQIKDKYPELFTEYLRFIAKEIKTNTQRSELLGSAQVVPVRGFRLIWNLFTQTSIGTDSCKTNYFALDYALRSIVICKLRHRWQAFNTLAIPYGIGCGLAGGDWNGVVYPMIQNIFKDAPLDIVIVKYNK